MVTEWKFNPGRIVATRAAVEVLPNSEVSSALERHLQGDWGDVNEEDRRANEVALVQRLRLLSVYCSAEGVKFWINTEWDRSVTTFLLPSDY